MTTNALLGNRVRNAVILSMNFTSMKPIVFDHVAGTTGSYTHDDYDEAMAQTEALILIARWATDEAENGMPIPKPVRQALERLKR
jgi:hypothetical protein